MKGTFKEFTETYEKVYRLKMVNSILCRMSKYADEISDKFEDEFDDCDYLEDFDTSGIEIALERMRSDIRTLQQYLNM